MASDNIPDPQPVAQKAAQDESLQQAGRLLRGEPDPQPTQPIQQPDVDAARITPLQASILLKADIANLAKKVKDKKTLSASERNLLQSALDGGKPTTKTYVDNVVELAEVLGVTRRTISRWKKVEGNPGSEADGRYNVAEWLDFKRQRLPHDDEDEIDVTREKGRNILLQNRKLEIAIAVAERSYVPASEIERWGGELGAAIRKVVTQIHLAAPNVVGVSVAEAEGRLKEIEDEILQQLHLLSENMEQYRTKPDESAV